MFILWFIEVMILVFLLATMLMYRRTRQEILQYLKKANLRPSNAWD